MELTAKQTEGLKEIIARYKKGKKYTTISGYAGTGKSTLIRFAIEALGTPKDKIAYASFTGKAAEVLRSKGNENAITLHKLLYDHFPKPSGGYARRPKDSIEYDIVVVDEVSMVPQTMIDLLLSHKVFVIFLGDPGQLEPIQSNETNTILLSPHVFLDEIMRQEAESEIIQVTMKIRNKEPIPYGRGKEVFVMPKNQLETNHLLWADQVLCATNSTRRELNNQMRECLGMSGPPQVNDKIICTQNRWDDIANTGMALVNGTTGVITRCQESRIVFPRLARTKVQYMDTYKIDFLAYDGSEWKDLEIDKKYILTGQKTLSDYDEYRLRMSKGKTGDFLPKYFDFGYAITTHKAQGSEWGNVLVLEEGFPYEKEEHARWLYTSCTRPNSKLILIR